jgi:PAS domain S-box-containing protein
MDRIAELELTTQRLELATRNARIAVWDWDLTDNTLYWSPIFLEILGIDPDQFTGRIEDFTDRLAPESRDHVQTALQNHFDHGTPYDIEYSMIHGGGHRVTVAARGEAVRDASGALLRMVGTVQDISDRRSLEQKLLRAERIGRTGHWELDVARNALTWSPETFRIHGLDPEDDPQPTVEEALGYYHPDDLARVTANFTAVFETGHMHGTDARVLLRNGEIRHVYADGVASARDDTGRPLRIFGIFQDRTEFVKKEEQLNRSQRLEAVGQLAGGVAHDFNNLLAVIHGNLELLMDDDPAQGLSHEERREMLGSAIAATRLGADLTRSILAFARKSQLQPKPVVINELIAETESWLARTIPSTIEISTRLGADSHICVLDPAEFQSAIVNIVVNARDAMPDGGKLTIETHSVDVGDEYLANADETIAPGRYCMVSVSDTGCGIAPELLTRVFEPFVSTKGLTTGTGLGLSRVQGFAKQSSGFVRIYSEVGSGTSVKMFFPEEKSEGAEPARQPTPGAEPRGDFKARVLIAEDQLEVLAVTMRVLKSAGYEIEAATNGDQAFALFQSKGPFDLLLTDVVMPGDMTGPRLAKACRALVPDLPVIFMSGYASEALLNNSGLRSDEIRVMKPVPKSELLGALAQALSRASG